MRKKISPVSQTDRGAQLVQRNLSYEMKCQIKTGKIIAVLLDNVRLPLKSVMNTALPLALITFIIILMSVMHKRKSFTQIKWLCWLGRWVQTSNWRAVYSNHAAGNTEVTGSFVLIGPARSALLHCSDSGTLNQNQSNQINTN